MLSYMITYCKDIVGCPSAEFYIMLMLSIAFLPFGVTERLAFLCNPAISLMFNSGAKMVVIMPEVKNAMLNTEKIAEHIDE